MNAESKKKLSIIIPCYNEENNIQAIVEKVLQSPVENKEIIIVDDCSTDNSRQMLKDKIEPLVSRIIYHEQNGGKGAALRTGFQAATGDVVIIQDADLENVPCRDAISSGRGADFCGKGEGSLRLKVFASAAQRLFREQNGEYGAHKIFQCFHASEAYGYGNLL